MRALSSFLFLADGITDDGDNEEQIYWLRPALISPTRSPDGSEKMGWFNKKIGNAKHKVTFNDIPSTSSSSR